MNGIYLHIPFCKQKCIYCDFFSEIKGSETIRNYVDALCSELQWRKNYLPSNKIGTIYLGGGTPSLLSLAELELVFSTIESNYIVDSNAEITMEANPDDIHDFYAQELATTPINRISLGIQSFEDKMLRTLNRRHSARQAIESVETLCRHGFDNISIDLIYGLPGQDTEQWKADVNTALSLPITHLSCYSLTYEEGTPLTRMKKSGQIHEIDEEISRSMYMFLIEKMDSCGWDHYEISNFARPGYRAKHNSGYWHCMNYLGCGPSAHSYNGVSRCWNAKQTDSYIRAKGHIEDMQEEEFLTEDIRWNEMVMVSLRTKEGIDLNAFSKIFGRHSTEALLKSSQYHIDNGNLIFQDDCLRLSRQGLFVSDAVIVDLMKD